MMSEISYHQQQYIRHQKREKKLVLFLRIFILLFFLVLWEISARTGLIDSFIFSSPVMIWHSFCSMCRDGSIFPHLSVTITETLVSFLFVVVLGAGMAVLLWTCPRLAKITEPYLVVLNSLPKSALAPLLIVWLADAIDKERAERSKARAEAILAQKNVDTRELELAEARLKRALVRSSVASRQNLS